MKKSILSLSAVALAGMFVASSASAVAIFDYNQVRLYAPYRIAKMGAAILPAGTGATKLEQHPAGTGHILLTPYYNAQGSNATLINIVNTDNYNGKAVKVRFRGASNSDDLQDFTVFLSPGDVWSGNVSQNTDTGLARLSMSPDDVSCMFPAAETFPLDFVTGRLDNLNQPAEVKAALTREGYVEVLNMADIPPFKSDGVTVNPLFTSIKHVNGTAPCAGALYNALFNTNEINLGGNENSYIDQTGLAFPTGNLMGSWTIMNQAQQGSFSGAQTAMIATTADMGVNGTVTTVAAGIAFSPQRQLTFGGVNNAGEIDLRTADPILVTGAAAVAGGPNNALVRVTGVPSGASIETPLWFDLPDLSTPILFDLSSNANAPTDQVNRLTRTLTKTNVQNEWIASNAGVQFDTDWVISQPTRRYHVAVDYANSRLVFGTISPSALTAPRFQGYDPVALKTNTGIGPVGCMDYGLLLGDRQETFATQGPVISPGTVKPTCGEVFTMQFTGTSTLNASVTATSFNDVIRPLLASGAGWGQLTMTGAGGFEGLPTLGFAAIQFSREDTGAIYNMTFPHRWATGTIDSQ